MNPEQGVESGRAFGGSESLPISSLLPDLIDQYKVARDERLDLAKRVEELEKHEKVLKTAIISKMKEQSLSLAGGKLCSVKLKVTQEPVAENWPEVWAYIKENDAFDLLHKRLTVEAVRLRWDDGIQIPGVGSHEVTSITPPSKL